MAEWACQNPSCKSHGQPHPNCMCPPPNMADGGPVKHYCSSNNPHKKGCQYYAEGGQVMFDDLQPDSPANLGPAEKQTVSNYMGRTQKQDIEDNSQRIVNEMDQKYGEPMAGQGRFRDTGRKSEGPAEAMDAALGAPARIAISKLQQGDIPGAISEGVQQFGKDPKTAPTGYDIASKATDNPYLGAGMATAIDLAQVPVGGGVQGAGVKAVKFNPEIRSIAEDYAKSKGFKLSHDIPVALNEVRAKEIAKAYDAMPHAPNDPQVKKAYNALINETMDQFQALKKSGLKVTPIEPGMKNPYASSQDMVNDVTNNKHLYFYPTEQGFGTDAAKGADHPLLQSTNETLNGKPLLANDIFRIVHDYFGHAKEGSTFGKLGEEKAWRHHMQMYSPDAQKALTTETRGQNSWVNFGPKAEANRANPANTTYADQKAGILPEWARRPGAGDARPHEELLSKIDTPEKAAALKGAEREKYLKALDEVFGSREQRAKDMGFGEETWYHGTTVPIDEFKSEAKGLSTGAGSAKKGYFFAQEPSVASDYADLAHSKDIVREGDRVTSRNEIAKEFQSKLTKEQIQDLKLDLYNATHRMAALYKIKNYAPTFEEGQQAQIKINELKKFIAENNKKLGFLPTKTEQSAELRAKINLFEPEAAAIRNKMRALRRQRLENSSEYTALEKQLEPHYNNIRDAVDIEESGGQNVLPVKLRAGEGPLHVKDYKGQGYRDTKYADEMAKAQAEGKSGVLFKNTHDYAVMSNNPQQDIATVFNPNQIRSVNAAFDPRFSNSALLMSGRYGAKPIGVNINKSKDNNYAEGGDVAPTPEQPLMFDQLQDDSQVNPTQNLTQEQPMSFDSLVDDSERYSTTHQKIVAGVEGVAKGVLGPIAPYVEKNVFGIPEQDILGRQEANPILHGTTQAAGLVGGMMTGTGEGAIMEGAGQAAAKALGLAKPASYAARVGSSAVKSAAEMAVLQSGDEASKMILNDPRTSAESAIANIGLATAIGGTAGGFITGAVSPLWDATVGTHVDKFLGGLKDHLNGGALNLTPDVEAAAQRLGIELTPELRAGLSGNPKAAQMFNELREIQHPEIMAGLNNIEKASNESILQSLGKSPEEIANYSEAEGGKAAMDSFNKEFKTRYAPIHAEYEAITRPFQQTDVMPMDIGALADKVSQVAQERGYVGADIPQQKVVDAVLNRLPKVKTAADLTKLEVTVDHLVKGDEALAGVGSELKSVIRETQSDIFHNAVGKDAPQLLERYAAARAAHNELVKVADAVGSELGLGRIDGPSSLLAKIAEKRSPEEFLRKLSPKGNAELIPFLQKYFPETLESIRDNELKQILKPAILGARGDQPLNTKILTNAIDRGLAGQKERINFAIPAEALEKIQAAKTIQDAIPAMKSSGTAGWQQKMMAYVPQSALSAVALMTGHNPVIGFLAGHAGKLLARDAPDAVKLGLLRFVASEAPTKAAGFKAMVDFMHNTIKGESMIAKAASAVLKPSAQILTDKNMPAEADRRKLDKIIEKYDKNPQDMMRLTNGQTGHYLPEHQASLTETASRQVQYLQSLKPRPMKLGPLDPEMPPSDVAVARYDRALDIATNPAVVLKHIKDGTLQISDIQDLTAMYPSLYPKMKAQITSEMVHREAAEEPIPYKTRVGLSIFLGQAVDSTMTPQAIMSAQPLPKAPAGQGQPPKMGKRGTANLGKSNKSYMTPNQGAESDKASRD